MNSAPRDLPTTSQLLEKIPFIKSPSFWVQKPIELPADIHPLPDDVQAYFVYPHTIEAHALQILPQQLSQLRAAHSQRLHLLASLAESKERARKARLNQLAPGWSEGGDVMQPFRRESILIGSQESSNSASGTARTNRSARKPRKVEINMLGEEDDEEEETEQVKTASSASIIPANLLEETSDRSNSTAADASLEQMRKLQMQDFVDGLFELDSKAGTSAGGTNSVADDLNFLI